jgi:predicted RNase H-like HicB family nuclease
MGSIRNTVQIVVERTEDEEYGQVYVATNDELGLVTDGANFEELLENIREVLALCLEDTDTVAEFNLVPNPRVVITMELPAKYAKTA